MLKQAFHLLMLACLLFGTAAIPAQAAPDAQVETRTTHYIMYSPQEFRPNSPACTYATLDLGIFPTMDGGCTFSMQVFLPEPARITLITFYFVDNDAIFNATFSFYRDNPQDSAPQEQLSYLHSGLRPESQTTQQVSENFKDGIDIKWIEVTNNLWAYQLFATIPTKGSEHVIFKGARVEYNMPITLSPNPVDEYITLGGYNFQPNRSDAPFIIYDNRISLNPPQQGDFAYSLFNLPISWTIKELTFYYLDNDAEMPSFAFGAWSPENGFQGYLENISFPDEPPSPNVISKAYTLSAPMAIPDDRRLAILFYPRSSNHALRGVRIRYGPRIEQVGSVQTMILTGMDFYPSNNTELTYQSRDLNLLPTSAASNDAYYASLHLPENKHVGQVKLYFRDTDLVNDLRISTNAYITMADGDDGVETCEYLSSTAPTTVDPQWISFSAVQLGISDPQNRIFRLIVKIPNGYENLELTGARVEYYASSPVYLPVMTK